MELLTVRETLTAALAPLIGAAPTVLAGHAGLEREVAWAASARPGAPLFPTLKGNELALAAAGALAHLDPPASLVRVIAGLAEREAAGLVLRGPVSTAELPAAVAAADQAALPLILLPPTVTLADVERAITTLVHDRRNALYARTTALHDLQLQLAAQPGAGRPLHTITEALARLTGLPAGLAQPIGGGLAHLSLPPGDGPERAVLLGAWTALAAQVAADLPWPGRQPGGVPVAEPPVGAWAVPDADGAMLLAAPVAVRDQLAAALVLLTPGPVGSSRVDLQACKLEYSIVSPK